MDIPIVYYPLTVLCIDDEELMLRTLKNYISPRYPVLTALSPKDAEQALHSSPQTIVTSYVENIIDKKESDSSEIQLNIRLEQLIGLLDVPHRTEEIGVMVVDYKLPGMDGIEFCHKSKSLPVMKILLTGHQDYQKVVSAFTNHTIQAFFPKNHDNLLAELSKSISQLTNDYFLSSTKQLRANIETKNKLPITDDELFKSFFVKTLNDMEIKQWALMDINGSFLFINSKQEHLYFVLHTEDSLKAFTKLYNEKDFQLFIEPINNRQKIPFFGPNIDPTDIEVSEWGKHMYKPQKFIGKKLYYWNIIKKEV